MTFLLFVVLSTATFAWYSVLNVASVGNLTFTASSNQGGGGDICLSWHELTENEYSFKLDIEPVTKGNGLYPMIPTIEGIVGETKFTDYATTDKFNKASQVESIAGGFITKLDSITPATPYLIREKGEQNNVFYVTNKADIDMLVTFTYQISADVYQVNGTDVWLEEPIVNKMRSALFIAPSDSEEYVLQGLVAKNGVNEEKIHYGVLESNKNVNDVEEQSKTQTISFVVPKKSYVKGIIAVWFDGVRMLDSDGSEEVSYDMYFEGSAYMED